MKRSIVVFTGIAGLLLALASPTFAAEEGKEVTIKGDAKCAKCALKETDKCQTVIQAEVDGKKPWVAALFRIDRESEKLTAEYEYQRPERWEVTLDNSKARAQEFAPA